MFWWPLHIASSTRWTVGTLELPGALEADVEIRGGRTWLVWRCSQTGRVLLRTGAASA